MENENGKTVEQTESKMSWGTDSEKTYINHIGTYAVNSSKRLPRTVALANYLVACRRRTNWGNLDKNVIMEHAQRTLNKLMGVKDERK